MEKGGKEKKEKEWKKEETHVLFYFLHLFSLSLLKRGGRKKEKEMEKGRGGNKRLRKKRKTEELFTHLFPIFYCRGKEEEREGDRNEDREGSKGKGKEMG